MVYRHTMLVGVASQYEASRALIPVPRLAVLSWVRMRHLAERLLAWSRESTTRGHSYLTVSGEVTRRQGRQDSFSVTGYLLG